MNEHTHRRTSRLLITMLSFSMIGIFVLFYFTILDGTYVNRIVDFKTDIQNLETIKSTYTIGETVQIKISPCKYQNIDPEITWHLIDSYLINYPSRIGTIQKGCRENLIIDLEKIPMNVVPGIYYFEGEYKYRINWLHSVIYYLKTKPFTIVGNEGVFKP